MRLFFSPVLVAMISIALPNFSESKVFNFTENNKLTLIHSAREGARLKIESVKKAKHHIHIITYFWDNKKYSQELALELRKAHERGVDVRIITTFIPTLVMDFFNKTKRSLYKDFKKRNSNGVLSLLKFSPGRGRKITNNIHEKIFLVDSEMAIIGGRNIADNSFAAKDMEVMLEGPVVNEVQEHFHRMLSFMLEHKIERNCMLKETLEEAVECRAKINRENFSTKDENFFPIQPEYPNGAKARILTNEILQEQTKRLIKSSERYDLQDDIIDTIVKIEFNKLRAYNYFILPTDRYRNYLEKKLEEGKEIKMISNSLISSSAISNVGYIYSIPEIDNLLSRGIEMHQWLGEMKNGNDLLFYLHEKVMLFDDDHGIIGSHNFGLGSTSVSSEIAVEFYSPAVVKELGDIFDHEFEERSITNVMDRLKLNDEFQAHQKVRTLFKIKFLRNFIKQMY